MKRKRFEKLLMGRHGKQAREVRGAVRELIEYRRTVEGHGNTMMFYNFTVHAFVTPVFYPYKEMLERIESEKPAIGFKAIGFAEDDA